MTSVRRPLSLIALLGVGAALLPAQAIADARVSAPQGNVYTQYHVALANGENGEPSIGWTPGGKAAMYGAGLSVARLTWDDAKNGSPMMTKDVTPLTGTISTLDTIVTVDQTISRTFFAELAGVNSIMSYSDDAGASWTQSTGTAAGALLDHESVGVGPFAPTSVPHPLATDAVYYCAQNGFNGSCGVSYDGGLTYTPGVPAYNTPLNDRGDSNTTLADEGGACSALHGHLRVGPDGTAYLPIKGCGGTATSSNLTNTEYEGGVPSVSVSTDNGQTWSVRMNPNGTNPDESDNMVAIGPKNTVYMTWQDGRTISDTESAHTTAAKVSISLDEGKTWLRTANLNPPGINNVMFPVVIAGDDDRAAVAFLGSRGVGDDQQNGTFSGSWDLFVSTTYDQGRTWSTVNATNGDWVHRGCIDNQGIAPGSPKNNVCANRNLLDFNDITVDSSGRVLVAYTKTCTTHACQTAAPSASIDTVSNDVQDYVLRQSAGRGLYAAFDPKPASSGSGGAGSGTAGSNASGSPGLANTASGTPATATALLALAALVFALPVVRRRRRPPGR